MNYAFKGCAKLTNDTLSKFKLLNWDKEKVSSLQHTFYNCMNLTAVPLKFIGKNVKTIHECFVNTGITYLPNDVFNASTSGYNNFFYSKLQTITPKLTLDNFIGDYSSFVGCALNYRSIETLYNALPVNDSYINDDPKNKNEYTLYIGYNSKEPYIFERIKKLFNITEDNFELANERLPLAPLAEFSNSNEKGWYVTFTDETTEWGKDDIESIT